LDRALLKATGMKRLALTALLFSACVPPGGDDTSDLVWNVEVAADHLVVGQSTTAQSNESLPSGESPMPLDASWYASPDGIVQLSSDVGATISIEALAPGTVMVYASAGGAQGGASREVELVVLSP
jgi:hypothetical protein